MEMLEIYDTIDKINTTLEENRNLPVGDKLIEYINENVQDICSSYDKARDTIIHDIEVMKTKHVNELDDLIRQHKTQIEQEKEIRNKLHGIWKGKKLIRQITNDRFYNFGLKYKQKLDKLPNEVLETKLTSKNIKIKRQNILTEHIGAKLAYAIISGDLCVDGISVNLCMSYIKYNDEMHPEYKPLSKVLADLKIYENTAKSLSIELQQKYDIDPDLISEEIRFFIATEK
jgi:hypothetical protein